MGFVEIIDIDHMRCIRLEDGARVEAPLKICDAEGKYRSPFDGGRPSDDLWFCAQCYGAYVHRIKEWQAEHPEPKQSE